MSQRIRGLATKHPCEKSRVATGGSQGHAGCQPSTRLRERPYLEGIIRQWVIEKKTQCPPMASMCT